MKVKQFYSLVGGYLKNNVSFYSKLLANQDYRPVLVEPDKYKMVRLYDAWENDSKIKYLTKLADETKNQKICRVLLDKIREEKINFTERLEEDGYCHDGYIGAGS
jgi:hypothetical protein